MMFDDLLNRLSLNLQVMYVLARCRCLLILINYLANAGFAGFFDQLMQGSGLLDLQECRAMFY